MIAASVHKHPEIMKLLSKAQLMQGSPKINKVKLNEAESRLLKFASDNDPEGVKATLE